ncbi:hypothetical protein [Pseudazoarcus pumilus]|uniref:Cathelicidin antimicrobial peptide C-terminal domain-containing protein n=1 Tax=Pseudazoarcus pumilus TaxID=2067960 RepID=A0A2I6S772_9RHOO|nr:hypothetical protein [Pseudazoarcus pumilus]AUN95098.1 hypothetical protein C0099_09205 [Pseudazoarcus pumilus]
MRVDFRLMTIAMLFPFAMLVGCDEPGPAEKAGAKVDQAVEDVKDAIEQDGPAEEAGEEIDNAVDRMTN